MCGAIAYARTQRITKLLIDIRGLAGFPSPTTFQRFFLAEQIAKEAVRVAIACVGPEELFDPGNFLTLVAHNRGVVGEMFTDEMAAEAWLLALWTP